ncbi:hypothetical protein B0H15DRAFT_789116, partial [Mycena belliarum]
NMAEVVWQTLEDYGLTGRVIAFMMDNATNNDTLVEAIERKCFVRGIKFSAKNSRLRCMPHTVHLAVLQLLEAIGAVEKTKKGARSAAYQDSVTAPPESDQLDENAVAMDDEDDNEAPIEPMPLGIKASVRKVCLLLPATGDIINLSSSKLRTIIRAVRSSAQRRQQWYKILSPAKALAGVHMLILDVKTRWSSTHQMMSTF